VRLKGKVALITGAGSGIGRSTALLFAEEGTRVAVADLSEENGRETVREIAGRGGDAIFVRADVTREDEVKRMVEEVLATYGQIDELFNNAGISGVGAVHEISEELWDKVMTVNVKGVFLPCKYVVPHMMERMTGSIINMSSSVAEMGLLRRTVYSASKGPCWR